MPTYYELHKVKLLKYQNEYYRNNKEKCIDYQKKYNQLNEGKIKQYYNGYYYPCIRKNKTSIKKMKELLAEWKQKQRTKFKDNIIVSL